MLVHRRVAIKQGGTLTLGGDYIWDLALLLEGPAAENEALVNWQDHSNVVCQNEQRLFLRSATLS